MTLRIYCSSDGSLRRIVTDRGRPRGWAGGATGGLSACDPAVSGESLDWGIKKAVAEDRFTLIFDPESEAARIEQVKQIILGNIK